MPVKSIIVFTNQKGGVGKTTSSCAVAGGLTLRGYRVLAIDLDPQGNLSYSVGAEIEQSATIYEAFKGTHSAREIIQSTVTCDILPSNILLSGADLELNRTGREHLLKGLIAPIADEYDYIIIDTPPALNVLTVNAYTVADRVVIPMVPEILSLQGIVQLKETIDTVKLYYNQSLTIEGILLTRYNSRMNLSKDVEEIAKIIAAQLGTVVFDARIRSCIAVAEAPAHCLSIMDYAPRSTAARDYDHFIDELLGGE